MDKEIIITKELVKSFLPGRIENSHKGIFGSVLNIAGSINYRGAAYLSTISAFKAGAGYVSLASIDKVINCVCTLCPEAVFIPLKEKCGTIKETEYRKIIEILPKYKVLTFGCGISSIGGEQKEIINFVKKLMSKIQNTRKSVVIDADGLNIISKLDIEKLPVNTLITPHPMELSRLLKVDIGEIQKNRIEYATIAAKKYNVIVVLKGYNTVITNGDEVYINRTGNSALAKAGSGDVLTGVISGFLAQGLRPTEAAVLGVYLHGLTGEIASESLTQYGVNASDLVQFISEGIKTII